MTPVEMLVVYLIVWCGFVYLFWLNAARRNVACSAEPEFRLAVQCLVFALICGPALPFIIRSAAPRELSDG